MVKWEFVQSGVTCALRNNTWKLINSHNNYINAHTIR